MTALSVTPDEAAAIARWWGYRVSLPSRAAVILLGEAPGRAGRPWRPLTGQTGEKLARLAGLEGTPRERVFLLHRVFSCCNIFPKFSERFSVPSGKAIGVMGFGHLVGRATIFVGKNPAACFGMQWIPPMQWTQFGPGTVVAWLPHPSGMNRWYNVPANREAAEQFMTRAADISIDAILAKRKDDEGDRTQEKDDTGTPRPGRDSSGERDSRPGNSGR